VRGARRRRRRARDPREHAPDGRGSRGLASVRAGMRVGADVGGTFTDVLALDADGRVRVTKVLSTPPDYDRAVVDAVRELAGPTSRRSCTGRRVATNAVLERRGAAPRSSRPRASATCSSCGACGCRTSTTTSGRSPSRSCRAASASRSPSG
jgi:hypothetical protein